DYLKAFIMALKAHYKQKDKSGKPYILHPLNVALRVKSKKAKVVALLHDVLEDSDKFSIENFIFLDESQKEALLLLTHNKNVPYMDYIQLISKNEIAKEVKIQDLIQNLNLGRLKSIKEKDISRTKKYINALEILIK
ncbi:MAG: GTP pyrophosphokinase, partial [Christensenellaceae bacterium]|nr:GTP pyrophosphokinase [Christensenellaceae bacterium]